MVTARRDRLRQELRDEIIAAARDLFVTEGYANVSIRKVADRVGCAPGTIYLYFEDKDSILSAICAMCLITRSVVQCALPSPTRLASAEATRRSC